MSIAINFINQIRVTGKRYIDTHKSYKKLVKAGFTVAQAEVIVAYKMKIHNDNFQADEYFKDLVGAGFSETQAEVLKDYASAVVKHNEAVKQTGFG